MSKSLRRLILLWHRWLGLASVPFVVLLVVTGVLLERTEQLQFDQRYVAAEWLLSWYGVAPEEDPITYRAGEHWVTWLSGTLYLDHAPVQRDAAKLRGAAVVGPAIVAATSEALYLFTLDGELVEKVTPIGLDGAIDAMAVGVGETLLIRTGGKAYASDIDMVSWQATRDGAVAWPRSQSAPETIRVAVLEAYRGTGLPWERVLLDLHSGRLLGPAGPYLMDAAAVLLLLLSASGLYNWVRRR